MPREINENTDLLAASPAYQMNRLMEMMGNGEQFLHFLAIVIIIVSGLSIFISLFSSLKERRYELALMRVMGASRSRLFFLIILEGLILATLGYVLGLLLSHSGIEFFSGYMEDAYRYSFTGRTFLMEEILLLGASLFIGLLAAILPAISASGTDISTTLTES
ncbi:MAG: FtsX-like permease family protein [Bacteroidota bacterium]